MKLSVIVSTYNRIDDLQRLLDSLMEQDINEDVDWEIVVSNNKSTDGTAEYLERIAKASPVPVNYVYQSEKAKSYGLNAALRAAKGSILAFTDDDIILPSGWLNNILEYFNANPAASCIGGPVVLYNQEDKDISIRTSQSFATYTKKEFNPGNMPIIGCNMALTRSLAETIGLFDTRMGPGSYIGSGDDLDYIYRAVNAGEAIQYVPDILVYHNHGRNSLADISRAKKRYMIGRGAFYSKYAFNDPMVRRWAYWELIVLFKRNWYLWVISDESRSKLSYIFWMAWGMIKWGTRPRNL